MIFIFVVRNQDNQQSDSTPPPFAISAWTGSCVQKSAMVGSEFREKEG